MTLQQKLLAKQSKKGFTLVELVVVIAILAILAAIAIPAVVGIIDNATKSSKQSNASALDSACKSLYSGVSAGSINQSSKKQELGSLNTSLLPAANASTSTKRSDAAKLTVQNAIEYAGLTSTFANENVDDYVYNKDDGTIIYKAEGTNTTDYIAIAANWGTTLAKTGAGRGLYGGA